LIDLYTCNHPGKESLDVKNSTLGRITTLMLMLIFLTSCGSDDDSSPTNPGDGTNPDQAGGFSGALPNGVGYDFEITAETRGPGGASLSDGDTDYGRIAEGSSSLSGYLEGDNDNCEGYSFPYQCTSHLDFSSNRIYTRTRTQANGNGTNRVDDYLSWGMATYDIYFEVTSSDPATTSIELSVPFSIEGIMSFSYGSDDDTDYVDVYTSCSLTAKVFETGTWEGEMGPEFGLQDQIAEASGSMGTGFESGEFQGADAGFLEGQCNEGAAQDTFAGSSSITVSVVPGEIMCLRYTMHNSAHVSFYGMYGFPAVGHAACEATGTVGMPSVGTDLEHPDAEISVTIHRAEAQ